MFKTRITELFGIKYPIIAGAMAQLSLAELVAAVSNAGGLGSLASVTFSTGHELKEEIRKTKNLTDKPFAVNFPIIPPGMMPEVEAVSISPEKVLEIIIEEEVRVVETLIFTPEPYMERFKQAGVKVFHKTPSLRHALSAEKAGVDAIAMLGIEGGGHPGEDEVGALVRIPATVDALKIPVIAAGGIVDARGFVAAMALGAEGVLMGTRFVNTHESAIHSKIREWMLQAKDTDTCLIEKSSRIPERVLMNKTVMELLELEKQGVTRAEKMHLLSQENVIRGWREGDTEGAALSSGQGVGLIHETITVKEVIDNMINGATSILERLGYLIRT